MLHLSKVFMCIVYRIMAKALKVFVLEKDICFRVMGILRFSNIVCVFAKCCDGVKFLIIYIYSNGHTRLLMKQH
jgi:hypothetical protein